MNIKPQNSYLASLRWVARGLSALSIVILLLFILGESSVHPASPLQAKDWLRMIFFPTGVMVGLLVAWWREGLGATISILCLLIFYGLNRMLIGRFPGGPYFFIFTSPSLLFGIYALLTHQRKP